MSFTKFVSVLEKQALFFCNSNTIGDPFEGSFSKKSIAKMKNHPFFKNVSPSFFNTLSDNRKLLKRFHFLNCWHMNEFESAAMWKLYLSNAEGIAIQSTFRKLRDCFSHSKETIYIGIVNYIDYESAIIPDDNVFWPYVHKRKSFEHEQELRAVIQKIPSGPAVEWPKFQPILGLYIPIQLVDLIETIYISPTAPSWFRDIVKVTCEKFGLSKSIQDSKLNERPVY